MASAVIFTGFLDPGPMLDGELELVAPHERWTNDLLASTWHPRTVDAEPRAVSMTRQHVMDFLARCPHGHQNADPEAGTEPAYHFWMLIRHPDGPDPYVYPADGLPPLRIAGGLGLRIGRTMDLEMYLGHIGYNVFPAAQGRHYAERACRLVQPLAFRHNLDPIWITCNPDNLASRRTCERLGAAFVDVVPLPAGHSLHARGERFKCRYRWDGGGKDER